MRELLRCGSPANPALNPQPSTIDLSFIGLSIQVVGVASIAVLFQLLHRAMPRRYFLLWSRAWLVMVVALVALRLSFLEPTYLRVLESVYYLGEYVFAWLLGAGFQQYPDRPADQRLVRRSWGAIAVVWSLGLAWWPVPFSTRFGVHAIVFSTLLAVAWWRLRAVQLPLAHRWAHRFALFGLGLLTVNFAVNGLAQPTQWLQSPTFYASYVAYQSIVDLFIEVLVAFGLVAVAAVDMRTTLERARATMQAERDRMSMLALQDGLTGCFNRLALDELKGRIGERWGSVCMVDLNYLKSLNDTHGHATGDLAIVHVANALQRSLRPSDHVFRTGGDEFVVVTFDLSQPIALQRVRATEDGLQKVVLQPAGVQGLSIAYGCAEFRGSATFDAAMAAADAAMYAHKQAHRTQAAR